MTGRPNVLILILDSLRASSMSLHGYSVRTTPQIDRFAGESTVFDQAISPATWTIPAHASLLSGLYASQHRIDTMEGNRRLNRRLVTLPEALRRTGYRTAAFSSNPLFHPSHGLGEGFMTFQAAEDLSRARRKSRVAQRLLQSASSRRRRAGLYLERLFAPENALNSLLDWLVVHDETRRPAFAFANLLAPHPPWVVPFRTLVRARALDPRYVTRRDYITLHGWEFNARAAIPSPAHLRMWRKLYDAAIMHVDEVFGRFVERAATWPGWSNTIVVVTSDHGEMLGDKGIIGHCLTTHDDLARVPLVVRHPDRAEGNRVPGVVQTHDLYRTILDWTGAALDAVPAAQRVAPSLDDPSPDRIAIVEEDAGAAWDVPARLTAINPSLDEDAYPSSQRAARTLTHKYVAYDTGPGEFYDLRTDPNERHNLISTQDSDVLNELEKLQTALLEWEYETEMFPPVELEDGVERGDDVVEERLRALGYL